MLRLIPDPSRYYDYKGDRRPIPSKAAADIVRTVARNLGVQPTAVPEEDALRLLLYPMINEAFKILDEGMAQRPSDVDVCYVHG
jgi:3-hydroxyacyl-CoA dehydrogenase